MDSNALNSQGPSKRKLTLIEDLELVEVLVEYHHEREVTLRISLSLVRYLKVLEGKISTKLPNIGLRAKPNIESRLRTLKRLSILPLFK